MNRALGFNRPGKGFGLGFGAYRADSGGPKLETLPPLWNPGLSHAAPTQLSGMAPTLHTTSCAGSGLMAADVHGSTSSTFSIQAQ